MKTEQTLATLENAFLDVVRRLPGAEGPVHNDWFFAGESPDRKGIYAVFMRPFEDEGDVITGTEIGSAKDIAKLAEDDDRLRELALAFLRAVIEAQGPAKKKTAPKKQAKKKATATKKKAAPKPKKKKAAPKAKAKPKPKKKAARKK